MSLPAWLQPVSDRLSAALEQARLPHAILLHGPGGWGEAVLANWLALRILDLDQDRQARELAHPDLRWVEPEDGGIKVEQIRALSDFVLQTAQRGESKVVVVDQAHRMNPSAANALLKTLEEPPAGSYLVLVSESVERLLATIRSRCQQYRVTPADPAVVAAWLEDQGDVHEALDMLLVEYGGAPYAVHEAVGRGEATLWEVLAAVAGGRISAPEAAYGLREDDLPALLGKWLRHVHRLCTADSVPRGLLEFADDLVALRAAALVNTGLARQVQLERLLLRWRDVYGSTARQPA